MIRHITEQLPQHKENTHTFLNNSEILETPEKSTEFYIKEIVEFLKNESGFIFARFNGFKIATDKYEPIRGRSYISLPKWIENKHAVINIKNDDDIGFSFCLAYGERKNEIKKNAERPKQYYDLLQKYDLKRDLGIEGSIPPHNKMYIKIKK